jgi:hypothetical protein
MLDHVKQWGLVTPQGNAVKLNQVGNRLWERVSFEQLERELRRTNPRVQIVSPELLT